MRLKEHSDSCAKCKVDVSTIAKHTWENDHQINWQGSKLIAAVNNYFVTITRESFIKTMQSVKKVNFCMMLGLFFFNFKS